MRLSQCQLPYNERFRRTRGPASLSFLRLNSGLFDSTLMVLDLPNGIRLTEFKRSDQDALVECLNDREIYDRTLRIPFPYTAADAEQWFGIVEKLTKQNGQPVNWTIRNADEKLIGGVGLEGPGLDRSHRAEIGYWLAKPFWGQGIMTAVVRVICRHAFENLGLAKITAHVFSFNDASARVLEKCGFEQEGYLKTYFSKDGRSSTLRRLE